METAYPWEGRVRLSVEQAPTTSRALSFRVPAWCAAATARVNGKPASPGSNGYLRIDRAWRSGDLIELELPMEPRLIEAHPWIESTRGCVAIERGPLVYCLEQADHPDTKIADLEIDTTSPLESAWVSGRLEGITVVRGSGWAVDTAQWKDRLYRPIGRGSSPEAATAPHGSGTWPTATSGRASRSIRRFALSRWRAMGRSRPAATTAG